MYSNGAYEYNTVYNMPIYLRRFTYNMLEEHYKKINKTEDDNIDKKIKQQKADYQYKSKAPKK